MLSRTRRRNSTASSWLRLPTFEPRKRISRGPSAGGKARAASKYSPASRVDREAGVLLKKGLGRLAQEGAADVDGHVGQGALPTQGGLDQEARLARGTGAELDESHAPAHRRHDLVRVGFEDRRLGPGGVVLRQVGDPLEQFGARPVVEEARRDALGGSPRVLATTFRRTLRAVPRPARRRTEALSLPPSL